MQHKLPVPLYQLFCLGIHPPNLPRAADAWNIQRCPEPLRGISLCRVKPPRVRMLRRNQRHLPQIELPVHVEQVIADATEYWREIRSEQRPAAQRAQKFLAVLQFRGAGWAGQNGCHGFSRNAPDWDSTHAKSRWSATSIIPSLRLFRRCWFSFWL